MKKVKVTELFREPVEYNCFRIEEILPDGHTKLLKIIRYDDKNRMTDVWGREVNLKEALKYAKNCEKKGEQKSFEVIYQTPEND